MHPTSASTERNWAPWGRVYTDALKRVGPRAGKESYHLLLQQPGTRSQHEGLSFALVCDRGQGRRCYEWAGVIDAGLCASVFEWQQGHSGAVRAQARNG
jgi:hypothetical protein